MTHTEAALRWIVNILRNHNVPFHITGGLAAKVYGSKRELADIDIDIPEAAFDDLVSDVKDYIVYGPQQFTDDSWDILLMTLNYQGQDIDIAGAYEAQLFDRTTHRWVPARVDLSKAIIRQCYGISVPVMRKDELIAYKSKLQREVDKEDLQYLLNISD